MTEPKKYGEKQVQQIRWIYLGAIFIWIAICYLLKLIPGRDWVEVLIVILPLVIFISAWYFADRVTNIVEDFMGKTNVLTLGLIIALPLLNWVQDRGPEKKQFTQIMAVAIIFSLLTLIDIWVGHDELCVLRHAESALQTMAITLLIFGLYRFFIDPHNEQKVAGFVNPVVINE